MKTNPDHERLFSRVCDGLASAAETTEFHHLLRTDADALDAWLHYSAMHVELAGGSHLAESAPTKLAFANGAGREKDAPDVVRISRRHSWLQWAPQAAAGVAFGLFTATIVWAYVAPEIVRSRTLWEDDFENATAPLATRVPLETGIWRGDTAAIVGAVHGVNPAHGLQMMRLLRPDAEVTPKPAKGHIAAVYRLIDLRPLRGEFADGAGVVEASVSFNAREFPADERYGCAITLYALDAETMPDRAERVGTALTTDALAMARSGRTMLDRDPASWQRVTTEIRLPTNAEFLVVRLHVSQAFGSGDTTRFNGSFADDVRVSFTRRAPLP